MTSPTGRRVARGCRPCRTSAKRCSTLVTTTLGLAVAVWLIDGVRVGLACVDRARGRRRRPRSTSSCGAPLRFLARRGERRARARVSGCSRRSRCCGSRSRSCPGIDARQPLAPSWRSCVLTAIVMAIGRWIMGANDSDYVIVRRRAPCAPAGPSQRASAQPSGGAPREAGMLVVQLDGVAVPVLQEAIEAGLAPNIQRWIAAGDHVLEDVVGAHPVDHAREPGRAAARRLRRRSRRSAGGTGTSAGSS